MFSFAKLSGLDDLARCYPSADPPPNRALPKQTVQIGPVRFKRCATVGAGAQGLHLQVKHLLSSYPPVLIPWQEIATVEETRLYRQKAMRLTIGAPEKGVITMPMELFDLLSPFLSLAAPSTGPH